LGLFGKVVGSDLNEKLLTSFCLSLASYSKVDEIVNKVPIIRSPFPFLLLTFPKHPLLSESKELL
jgi:hypothetical protein